MIQDYDITVYGMVQGVGFRPYVAELAEERKLSGSVRNAGGVVKIHLRCTAARLDDFLSALRNRAPQNSRIEKISVTDGKPEKTAEPDAGSIEEGAGFRILPSGAFREKLRFLPPDLPVCDRCAAEMLDPANRRYRHPFISCVSCGPRFSIMERIPYDRENTVMGRFPMCRDCRREYTEKGNIRRHAQTIACHHCGPELFLARRPENVSDGFGPLEPGEKALSLAVSLLLEGKTGAVKDIGGYHFICRPDWEAGAEKLRRFKNRERKPFAVMFPNVREIRKYCRVSDREEALLKSPPRPIVLLEKLQEKRNTLGVKGKEGDIPELAAAVCCGSDRIGAMLPCNPLQILLLRETGPLIMTSGNRGGDPIVISDEKMLTMLGQPEGPDFVLYHNREILTPLDDSIYQVNRIGGREVVQILRRARGIVPEPIFLDEKTTGVDAEGEGEGDSTDRDLFLAGGDLKAVFGLMRGNAVFLSGQFGDLENRNAAEARGKARQRMEKLLDVHPSEAVTDLHPGYFSVRKEALPKYMVQHHVAHMASVLAEHGLQEPCIGVVFDGTGYGTDGTVRGSEFLIWPGGESPDFLPAGSFRQVLLAGGNAASRNPAFPLLSYLHDAEKRALITDKDVENAAADIPAAKRRIIGKALENNVNCVMSSSMGRLFDAAAALTGVCMENTYEGECPAVLEQHALAASLCRKSCLKDNREGRKDYFPDGARIISRLAAEKARGMNRDDLAFLFHVEVAEETERMLRTLSAETGIRNVVLSGGTFYNRLLLRLLLPALEEEGFRVYLNEKVPCGDGGLALGQAWLAGKRRENRKI